MFKKIFVLTSLKVSKRFLLKATRIKKNSHKSKKFFLKIYIYNAKLHAAHRNKIFLKKKHFLVNVVKKSIFMT